MIKNKSILYLLLLFVNLSSFSQTATIGDVIDSLQHQYTLYPNEYPLTIDIRETAPPPPSLLGNNSISSRDIVCLEAYNIPTEILTNYYPWNADSIVVSTYEQGRLGVLDKESKEQLTHILYNYDIKVDRTKVMITRISIIGSGMPIPNFRLMFHHQQESFFADVYLHINNPMLILDSSYQDPYENEPNAYSDSEYDSYIYWGKMMTKQHDMMIDLLEAAFDTKISCGNYENDYEEEIPLIDLIEYGKGF